MAFLDIKGICDAYEAASTEADQWREDYPEFERLMNNGLLEGLDEDLPEVNDGSLAASLFKLSKRVIRKKMSGRPIAHDREDKWINDFASIQWENNILKHATSMASPRRKWKDAVRKAAGYGSQPIISLPVNRNGYSGADFIVPYAQDVKLEAGKVSDEDSDIIFWDVYYSKLQVENMIETAEEEMAEAKADKEAWKQRKAEAEMLGEPFEEEEPAGYNKWNIPLLKEILKAKPEEERPGNQEHSERKAQGVKNSGIHFYIAFQRGVNAPFTMMHKGKKKPVREWSNPDPTGDVPVHYLYCYQDFINPYGIGIVKLAGGTQNILDYFMKADILATQLGLRRPKIFRGATDTVDWDSLTYTEDADWDIGQAELDFVDMADGVYRELPGRISMHQTRLQRVLPMGDTSIASGDSGDPQVGKTPQALKMADSQLSIDDEDFTENVDECYAAVARSCINIHFATMNGNDLIKLKSDQREIPMNAGVEFPLDENGEPTTNELEFSWDEVRASFDFEVDPEADKTADEETALDGKLRALEILQSDPAIDQYLMEAGKRLNRGELLADIFGQLTNNDKIIEDISPEEQEELAAQAEAEAAGIDPATGQPVQPPEALEGEVLPAEGEQPEITEEEAMANIQAIMEQYNVDQRTAAGILEAERQGWTDEQISEAFGIQVMTQEEPVL